jgi:LmbE family N-acetylglucosaminyl deacetylase
MERVLIVAAHPDDDILSCGGTVARFSARGCVFKVVFIAEGTTARYDAADINSARARDEVELRYSYARKALASLNITDYSFHGLPSCRLDTVALIDIGKIIEREIKAFRPDTVFTHSNIDTNNDHNTVFQATLQATRPCGGGIAV